ncbi:MAG TPA: MBL fold metallo-hydrolase [Allosphingosinicella sp.]
MRPTLHPRLVNGRFGDPAIFVDRLFDRSALLFDLGDLSALSTRDLLRVTHVFVSHMHMDHFIGFDALLRVHVGRAKRIVVTGPKGIGERLGHKLAGYEWDLVDSYEDDLVFDVIELLRPDRIQKLTLRLRNRFAFEAVDFNSINNAIIIATPDFTVSAAILEHHGVSVGYAVAEPLHVNIWGNKVQGRGLALGPWLKPLKQAVRDGRPNDWPVAMPDGSHAPLESLRDLVSVEPGQKVAYVTDVRDTPANREAIVRLCKGADLLFIEASFAARDKAKADARAHLTTAAAGEIARAAGVRRVEPFHFSPRYEAEEAEMLAEVDAAFRRGAQAA